MAYKGIQKLNIVITVKFCKAYTQKYNHEVCTAELRIENDFFNSKLKHNLLLASHRYHSLKKNYNICPYPTKWKLRNSESKVSGGLFNKHMYFFAGLSRSGLPDRLFHNFKALRSEIRSFFNLVQEF